MSSSPQQSPRRIRKESGLKMKYSESSLTNELYDTLQIKTSSSTNRKNPSVKQSTKKYHSSNQNDVCDSLNSLQNGNMNYSHKREQAFKKGSVSQLSNAVLANSSPYSISDVSSVENKHNINVLACLANKRTRKLTDSNLGESLFSLPKFNDRINNLSTTFCQCQSMHQDLKQPTMQNHSKSKEQVYEKENLLTFQRSNHTHHIKNDTRSDEKKTSASTIESHHNSKKDDYCSHSHPSLIQRDSISSTASGGETQNLRCEQSSTSVSPCRPCCQPHPSCASFHHVSESPQFQPVISDKECRIRYDSHKNPLLITDKRHTDEVNSVPHSKSQLMSNSLVQTKKEIQFFKENTPSVNDLSIPNDIIQPAFVFGKHQRSINPGNGGLRDRYLKDLKQLEKKLILKGKKKSSENIAQLVQLPSVHFKGEKQQRTSHDSTEGHFNNYTTSLKNSNFTYTSSPGFFHGSYTHAIDSNNLSMKEENEELKASIRHLSRKIAVLEAHMERDEVVIASSQNRLQHIKSYLLEIQPNYSVTSSFGYHLKRLLSIFVSPSDEIDIKSFNANISYDKVVKEPLATSLSTMKKHARMSRKNKTCELTEKFFKHHHLESVHFQPTRSFNQHNVFFSVSSDPDFSPRRCHPEEKPSHSPENKQPVHNFKINKKQLRKNTSRPPIPPRYCEDEISSASHSDCVKEKQTTGQSTTGINACKKNQMSSNLKDSNNDRFYDKSLNNAPCSSASASSPDSNCSPSDTKFELQQKKKPHVPLLGLQKKNVGFGTWLSGQPTQGDTYNSTLHTVQSN